MRLCLYQPEIPQNTGTLLRTAACFGVGVDIIEPCGFGISDRKLRRAGLDYTQHVDLKLHDHYKAFCTVYRPQKRLVLLSTKATDVYTDFCFRKDDILMLGREADGVPERVEDDVDARIIIPMQPACRSLNVAIAGAVVLSEAMRQLKLN